MFNQDFDHVVNSIAKLDHFFCVAIFPRVKFWLSIDANHEVLEVSHISGCDQAWRF